MKNQGDFETRARSGRWPTNILLVHGPECVKQGTRQVAGITGGQHVVRRSGVHSAAGGHQAIGRVQPPPKHYCSDNGTESIAAWECQPDCPVRLLDEMSGESKSGSHKPYAQNVKGWKNSCNFNTFSNTGDSGTASRFFPQFPSRAAALDWLNLLIGHPR